MITTAHILKYYEVAAINCRAITTQSANYLSRSGIIVLRIWVYSRLYILSYASIGTSSIGGMTLSMVVWSVMVSQTAQMSTRSSLIIRQVDEDIKNGSIAYALNKPYSYILFQYFTHIGKLLPNIAVLFPISCLITWLLIGPLHISLLSVFAAIVLFIFGTTIDFLMAFLISLSAFWIEDASAFRWLYEKGQIVFGGQIIPLALFPGGLRTLGEILPFSQLYYSSSRLLVGYDSSLFLRYIGLQVLWLIVFIMIVRYLFARSIRYVAINGG